MVDLTWVKQSMTRLELAWLASVSGTCHVELDKLPKVNNTKNNISPKILFLAEFVVFFIFFENQTSERSAIHFTTNRMQIKSNEKIVWGNMIKNIPR